MQTYANHHPFLGTLVGWSILETTTPVAQPCFDARTDPFFPSVCAGHCASLCTLAVGYGMLWPKGWFDHFGYPQPPWFLGLFWITVPAPDIWSTTPGCSPLPPQASWSAPRWLLSARPITVCFAWNHSDRAILSRECLHAEVHREVRRRHLHAEAFVHLDVAVQRLILLHSRQHKISTTTVAWELRLAFIAAENIAQEWMQYHASMTQQVAGDGPLMQNRPSARCPSKGVPTTAPIAGTLWSHHLLRHCVAHFQNFSALHIIQHILHDYEPAFPEDSKCSSLPVVCLRSWDSTWCYPVSMSSAAAGELHTPMLLRKYERAPLLPVQVSAGHPASLSRSSHPVDWRPWTSWSRSMTLADHHGVHHGVHASMTMAVCSFLRVKGLNSPWNMCHWGWSSLNILIELHAASIHMPVFSEQSMNLIAPPKTCFEHVSHWESNSLMVDSKLVFLWTQRFFALESLKVLVLGVGNVIENPCSWDSNMLRMLRRMTMLSASTLTTHVSNSVTMCSITSHSSFGPNCIDGIRICMLNQQTNHWIDFVGMIFFRNY